MISTIDCSLDPSARLFLALRSDDAPAAKQAMADGANVEATERVEASKNAPRGLGRWSTLGEDAGTRKLAARMAPLAAAAAWGARDCLQLLLKELPENILEQQAPEALYFAAAVGCADAVNALLTSRGPQLANHESQPLEDLPIFAAAESGHDSCVEILAPLSELAERNSRGRSALHVALGRGHASTAMMLARDMERLKLSASEIEGVGNLVEAAAEGGNIACLEAALEWAPEGVHPQGADRSALMWAASANSLECVQRLLPLSDPRYEDEDYNTALHVAAQWGPDCVKALIPASDIEATESEDRKTALLLAIRWGHAHAVADLLAAGASITAKDKDGRQAMHIAASASVKMISAMAAAGLDGKVVDKEGRTPLMILADLPHWLVGTDAEARIEALLPISDVHAIDKHGETATQIARSRGNSKIADAIEARSALEEARELSEALPQRPPSRKSLGL